MCVRETECVGGGGGEGGGERQTLTSRQAEAPRRNAAQLNTHTVQPFPQPGKHQTKAEDTLSVHATCRH